MEMDWNLKKLTNFSKFVLCILENWLNIYYSLLLLGEIISYFLPGALRAISF